jgi:iron complex transport system substrate-binding protein
MRNAVIDDLRHEVTFHFPPRRVVSLCPSLTETLFAVGLDENTIVGRTTYCIHPAEGVQGVPVVGGTKSVDVERIRALEPDLVIAEKEENPRQVVETLAETLPVFVFDVTDFESALRAISTLGALSGRAAQAEKLVADIRAAFAQLHPRRTQRVAYLVWRNPYMAAGQDTYIHALLERCGFENVCAPLAGRYPVITDEVLRDLAPEWILLSSEPFSFDDAHVAELGAQIPTARAIRVDGEMFGWYGSRMLAAARYLEQLVARLDTPWTA